MPLFDGELGTSYLSTLRQPESRSPAATREHNTKHLERKLEHAVCFEGRVGKDLAGGSNAYCDCSCCLGIHNACEV